MLKFFLYLIRKIIHSLNPKFKRIVKRILRKRITESLRRLVMNGNPVEMLRIKMLELGFLERGYEDLKKIANSNYYVNSWLTRQAARELALWHANQYTERDAIICLEYLKKASKGRLRVDTKRKLAIMKAECYQILGDLSKAKEIIYEVMENDEHPDLCLAAANLEETLSGKINWINRIYKNYGLSEISFDTRYERPFFDRLKPESNVQSKYLSPKVTIIMPVYNAENWIRTSLESVLHQTWENIEVLVVDDCSQDNTFEIAKEYEESDSRVRVMRTSENSGPYVARNLALGLATGDFVTCHDADDWSHPQKIEEQVVYLLKNPNVIGNTSAQARAKNDLSFHRRGNFGKYIFQNLSSFMFRRKIIMDTIGYWDSVRFGADSEFIRRIRKKFGNEAIVELSTGPLSFQRQSDDSLTGNRNFGYHGFYMGARREYFEISSEYHEKAKSLKYEFPQNIRPFPVPDIMLPSYRLKNEERKRFDIIIVADFRKYDNFLYSILKKTKLQKKEKQIGLIQLYCYDYSPLSGINSRIREQLDGKALKFVVYGEKVLCSLLIIWSHLVLKEKQIYIPDVEAEQIMVFVDEHEYYQNTNAIDKCKKQVRKSFGKDGIWLPKNVEAVEKIIKL